MTPFPRAASTAEDRKTVLRALAKRSAPVSVRSLTDTLDSPSAFRQHWTRSEVRHVLEGLVGLGWAERSRGRLRWTVRYSATTVGRGIAATA